MLKVSIIVPTYNSEKYIKNLCNSIKNQTFQNFEVIIVDNSSSDNTVQKLRQINIGDKRFKYFNITNNGVIAKSRNLGIKKSSGQYLAFHDSDDFWFKDKLQIMISYLKNFDFAYHRLKQSDKNNFFNNRKLYSYQLSNYKNKAFIDIMTKGNPIDTSSVVCKKELFKDITFNENKKFITVEDYDCWIKISLKKVKFKQVDKVLGFYNIDNSNTSLILDNSPYKYLNIYNSHKNFIKSKNDKIFSKNNFRYLVANYIIDKKLKRRYFSYLFFSKINKSKIKIFLKFILSIF